MIKAISVCRCLLSDQCAHNTHLLPSLTSSTLFEIVFKMLAVKQPEIVCGPTDKHVHGGNKLVQN